MNELQIFNNPEFGEIRAIEIDGEPWVVGKDVAKALGYKNPQEAIRPPGGRQNIPIINESGVYSLIFSSKLPKAKKFKRWVTSEVLPSIRKTGAYHTPEAAAQEAVVIELLEELESRVPALEQGGFQYIGPVPAPKQAKNGFTPGLAARKRWMRTASEKLDLMLARFNTTHNEILHSLYKHLEKRCCVVLEKEKLRAMEEHTLVDCSVLTAFFYNAELRDAFEENIDYNLAPENCGW